jgi:hypothetical protein
MTENHSIETRAEALLVLQSAGITPRDVEQIVRSRAAAYRAQAVAAAERLRSLPRPRVGLAGLPVPEEDRWGRGAKVTRGEALAFVRVLGAVRAQLTRDIEEVDTDALYDHTALVMARRCLEGKHEENLSLIELYRGPRT